jgi:hypothetical protein
MAAIPTILPPLNSIPNCMYIVKKQHYVIILPNDLRLILCHTRFLTSLMPPTVWLPVCVQRNRIYVWQVTCALLMLWFVPLPVGTTLRVS